MHKRTHDAIARIAAGLGMRIDRADEESVDEDYAVAMMNGDISAIPQINDDEEAGE